MTNVGALKFQWHKVKASYRVPVEDSVTERDYGSLRIPYHNYCVLKNLINVTHLDEIKLKIWPSNSSFPVHNCPTSVH